MLDKGSKMMFWQQGVMGDLSLVFFFPSVITLICQQSVLNHCRKWYLFDDSIRLSWRMTEFPSLICWRVLLFVFLLPIFVFSVVIEVWLWILVIRNLKMLFAIKIMIVKTLVVVSSSYVSLWTLVSSLLQVQTCGCLILAACFKLT